MAWAEQLPSGNWRACWRDLDGKQHGTTRSDDRKPFTREAAAKRIAGAREDDARRGLATADGRAPTWDVWCEEWLRTRRVESSTHKQDLVRLERHLRPKWGKRRLNTITRRQVQEWVNDLEDTPAVVPAPKVKPEGWVPSEPRTLSPSTIDKIFRLFSASMRAATLDERVPLSVNPCVGVKLPAIARGHERYLTRAEVDAIAFRLNEPWRTTWLLLVGTGLRFGELAGLHWQRVGTDSIVVQETWDPSDKRMKPYPKSKKPRTVPIMPWVRPVLDAQRGRTGGGRSCGQRHTGGAKCRSGLVLVTPRGGAPLDGQRFGQRQFAEACAHAGLDGVRPHDGRHTFASWLRQGGVDLETVQELLGHASIVTTQRYSHLGASQLDRVLAAMS